MMGYISLQVRFDQPKQEADALRGAFECDIFRPQAIGALGDKGTGSVHTKWFLGGWGLEDFVCSYVSYAETRKSHEFFRLTGTTSPQDSYLDQLEAAIKHGTRPTSKLSPFEYLDQVFGVTFLTSQCLNREVVKQCVARLSDTDQRIFELCGNFSVAVDDSEDRDWSTAYRFVFESDPTAYIPVGAPFVSLTARSDFGEPNVTQLILFSEATIWLEQADSLHGHVCRTEAGVNLSHLQRLAESLIKCADMGIRSADLSIEGAAFRREAKRIEHAFANIV